MNAPSEDAVVGRPIGDWMDDFEFITAFSFTFSIGNQRSYKL